MSIITQLVIYLGLPIVYILDLRRETSPTIAKKGKRRKRKRNIRKKVPLSTLTKLALSLYGLLILFIITWFSKQTFESLGEMQIFKAFLYTLAPFYPCLIAFAFYAWMGGDILKNALDMVATFVLVAIVPIAMVPLWYYTTSIHKIPDFSS